jgi:HD-GYP domain-containing protein (c-di-GMP phosphodiesterase class II)
VEKRINSELLRPGMFVCRLDKPWLETPFLLQGFLIRTQEQAEEVRRHCGFVYIDPERGDDVGGGRPARLASDRVSPIRETRRRKSLKARVSPLRPLTETTADFDPDDIVERVVITPIEEELERAFDLHRDTRYVINKVLNDARLGKAIDVPEVKALVAELAQSAMRNPDALIFLTQLQAARQSVALHCINACIFSLIFGRHLELPEDELRTLGLGALLHDVGYIKLPQQLLEKPGTLTVEESELIRTHVAEGVTVLQGASGITSRVVALIQDHHERWDGRGYPRGKARESIDYLGRVLGMVDVYDALTSPRPWRPAHSPYHALRLLQQNADKDFERALVLQFVQCIGIYPVGSIVQLNTGDVGIVVFSHPRYRLRPRVRLLFDPQGDRYETPLEVDLIALQGAGPSVQQVTIQSALPPGKHGIGTRDLIAVGLHP